MNIFNNLFQNSIQDVEYSSEFHSSSNISLGDILIGRFNTLNPDHSAGNRDEQQALFITQRIENVINHDNLMGNSNNNNLNNNNNNITNNFNNISNNGGIIPSPTFPSHSEDISNIETITLRRNQRKYDKDNINKKLKVLFFKTFYSQITPLFIDDSFKPLDQDFIRDVKKKSNKRYIGKTMSKIWEDFGKQQIDLSKIKEDCMEKFSILMSATCEERFNIFLASNPYKSFLAKIARDEIYLEKVKKKANSFIDYFKE